MDLDEFRAILSNSRIDVWGIIDAAITVASTDFSGELKLRRDGIVDRLYGQQQCRNCDLNVIAQQQPNGGFQAVTQKVNDGEGGGGEGDSTLTPQSNPQDEENEELDPYGGLFDDEQTKVLRIKEQLEDPGQTEDSVVELLQTLADMDLTFKGLKETDIGRHVNRLRKHPSNEVRSLVKQLVRKWKDLVDEWVGSKNGGVQPASLTDGDSPLLQSASRRAQNDHQGLDSSYSPNLHDWSPGFERKNSEQEQRPKTVVPKRETPSKPISQSHSPAMAASASALHNRQHKEQSYDLERLASARKRLQENYQEAQNAKKQRTIQVMDIHEIPKPKNGFIAKNKGNFQGRHHR